MAVAVLPVVPPSNPVSLVILDQAADKPNRASTPQSVIPDSSDKQAGPSRSNMPAVKPLSNVIQLPDPLPVDYDPSKPICSNCTTQKTSLWRRDDVGALLCNACALFQRTKGRPRPKSLKTDVIKQRNRNKKASNAAAGSATPEPSRSQSRAKSPASLRIAAGMSSACNVAGSSADRGISRNRDFSRPNLKKSLPGGSAAADGRNEHGTSETEFDTSSSQDELASKRRREDTEVRNQPRRRRSSPSLASVRQPLPHRSHTSATGGPPYPGLVPHLNGYGSQGMYDTSTGHWVSPGYPYPVPVGYASHMPAGHGHGVVYPPPYATAGYAWPYGASPMFVGHGTSALRMSSMDPARIPSASHLASAHSSALARSTGRISEVQSSGFAAGSAPRSMSLDRPIPTHRHTIQDSSSHTPATASSHRSSSRGAKSAATSPTATTFASAEEERGRSRGRVVLPPLRNIMDRSPSSHASGISARPGPPGSFEASAVQSTRERSRDSVKSRFASLAEWPVPSQKGHSGVPEGRRAMSTSPRPPTFRAASVISSDGSDSPMPHFSSKVKSANSGNNNPRCRSQTRKETPNAVVDEEEDELESMDGDVRSEVAEAARGLNAMSHDITTATQQQKHSSARPPPSFAAFAAAAVHRHDQPTAEVDIVLPPMLNNAATHFSRPKQVASDAELSQLRIRVAELELINGLMGSRLEELENRSSHLDVTTTATSSAATVPSSLANSPSSKTRTFQRGRSHTGTRSCDFAFSKQLSVSSQSLERTTSTTTSYSTATRGSSRDRGGMNRSIESLSHASPGTTTTETTIDEDDHDHEVKEEGDEMEVEVATNNETSKEICVIDNNSESVQTIIPTKVEPTTTTTTTLSESKGVVNEDVAFAEELKQHGICLDDKTRSAMMGLLASKFGYHLGDLSTTLPLSN